jgi:Ca-activated chloride channel family protein
MVRFADPLYLWLLALPALLLVLWAWRLFRRRADIRRSARVRIVPLHEGHRALADMVFWLCLILASALCIVAVARPEALVSAVRTAAVDLVLLQDGSASMAVRDVAPDRWQRSVRFLRTFADSLSWKGDRIALALFARLASPQVRLTRDPNALFFFLDHLGERSPFRLSDDTTWDTNIEEGLTWGLKLVEKDEELFGETGNAKAFVVVSDGQAWSGRVANALAGVRRRRAAVYVVGVGTTAGGWIPEAPRFDGTAPPPTLRSVLDRDSLRQIALSGGGEYFELGREPDRIIASRIISSVRRSAPPDRVVESYQDLYWPCLFAAATLLVAGTLFLRTRAELIWQAAAAAAAALFLAAI